MGYCYFGRCECSLLMDNGFCVYDTIDKCIHPAAVEDYKDYKTVAEAFRTHKYIENEPPKPNPDFVVVTRCKDCIYGEKDNGGSWWCLNLEFLMTDGGEGFCSYGKRKDGDGK